jgi:hypothetical protein
MTYPYAVPSQLSADLARVLAYWKGLLRGSAAMPFWDDVKPTELPEVSDRLLLIDVFERPARFRLNSIGRALGHESVVGQFLDEIDSRWPFDFLTSQCSATVEAAAPTYFRLGGDNPPPVGQAYSRLLLPLWGEGHVAMLLGAFDLS